ncbi:hypothetical protein AMES_7395 [Amycolatopsis mediterranei S699]|uniref:Uncharacterized protein n=2 Tax=Amycolatopsis mediterranei TaxID=33910 RepID=A0A0H3DEU5_AMYMU|nr:hypothetical protein [Amycolatopsis mediterranei]ADJ49221.1 hypothetical protein AMED_7507 [Amycolatopsis mediterranei U32]AEK46183.1 hypothetical protein RAM_38580 [Amycolatopsis mediterranei S699]AFO80928.1 hypothetical protein AMES_7395 [Amycolatopsis mediterranei S699]AGT88056.1 hypothetical protein B737_7395 [Amycolatopsis mediterranei RB]KDO04202.1 hypothetical protein DV26_46820 [Amycolatopsis mediterranei]
MIEGRDDLVLRGRPDDDLVDVDVDVDVDVRRLTAPSRSAGVPSLQLSGQLSASTDFGADRDGLQA